MKKYNKKTITGMIERGITESGYSIYVKEDDYPYGILGTGETVEEAKQDFLAGYQEMKECVLDMGKEFIEVGIVFRYDIPSFLEAYAYAFTLAGLERITGINQKQLGHYISGYRKPSEKTVRKIDDRIHAFAEELSSVRFI